MSEIYLQPGKEFTSAKDVIETLFMNDYGRRSTYARLTWSDKDCKVLQSAGQRRSFEDLLDLARTYFPDTTEKELMKILVDGEFKCLYCIDINKTVFFGNGGPAWDPALEFNRYRSVWAPETYQNAQLLELYKSL